MDDKNGCIEKSQLFSYRLQNYDYLSPFIVYNRVFNVTKVIDQRLLAEENLIGSRLIKKPRLNEVMKKKKLQLAREQRNMIVAD